MAWPWPNNFRADHISLVVCVLLAAGLWLTQQFSKSYQRWITYPVEMIVPADKQEHLFRTGELRIRLKQSGWLWAMQPSADQLPIQWNYLELGNLDWDRSEIYSSVVKKLGLETDAILEIDGLNELIGLRGHLTRKVPVVLDPALASLPSGACLSDVQDLKPDSIILFGNTEVLNGLNQWTAVLPEGTRIISGSPIDIPIEPSTYPGLSLSAQSVHYTPVLDQLTEKKWELLVMLPDSLDRLYTSIPRLVQIIALLPAAKYDHDSLELVIATLRDPSQSDAEGIQLLEAQTVPSFVRSYRLTPPFVSLFRLEE